MLRLQGRLRALNGGNRYFAVNEGHKNATGEIIIQIYNDIYGEIGPDAAAIFSANKSTGKNLDRFGAVCQFDREWANHLDYIDAHIESIGKLLEFQLDR